VGAGIVNGAKSYFTEAFPEYWLYFLGLLFVLATLYLPQGVLGLIDKIKAKKQAAKSSPEIESSSELKLSADAEAGVENEVGKA